MSALYRFHCILYFLAYNPKILDNLKTGEKVAVFESIMSNIINKYTIKAITTNTFLSKSSTPHKFLLLFAPCPRTSSHSSPSFDEKDMKMIAMQANSDIVLFPNDGPPLTGASLINDTNIRWSGAQGFQ